MFWIIYLQIGKVVFVLTLIYALIVFLVPKFRENFLWNIFGNRLTIVLKSIVFWLVFAFINGLLWIVTVPYFLLGWVFQYELEKEEKDKGGDE